MKKLILIIIFLCIYISQSNKIYNHNKEIKIKKDIHMIGVLTNNDNLISYLAERNLISYINLTIEYPFILNSFIAPIVGMKAETIIVLTPNKVINKVYLHQIGDWQSDIEKFINIYLIQSTGKLGRT
jgi:hypothetical protein